MGRPERRAHAHRWVAHRRRRCHRGGRRRLQHGGERLPPLLRPGLRRRCPGRRRDRPLAGIFLMLTDIWLLPVVGGILVAFLPAHFAKWVATLTAALTLAIAA